MAKRVSFFVACGSVAAAFCFASRTEALVYTLDPFTGTSAQVQLTLTQLTPKSVQIGLQVLPNPNIGDLRGFFFNISDDSLLSGLSVSGSDITQTVLGPAGTVGNLGGGNNINPEGPFDIGLGIGTAGIGSDDIQNTTFTVSSAADIPVSLFTSQTDPTGGSSSNALLFAVRLTSVGLPGGARSGSSKLGIHTLRDPGSPHSSSDVPEPGPLALLLTGGGSALFFLRSRQRRNHRSSHRAVMRTKRA